MLRAIIVTSLYALATQGDNSTHIPFVMKDGVIYKNTTERKSCSKFGS